MLEELLCLFLQDIMVTKEFIKPVDKNISIVDNAIVLISAFLLQKNIRVSVLIQKSIEDSRAESDLRKGSVNFPPE